MFQFFLTCRVKELLPHGTRVPFVGTLISVGPFAEGRQIRANPHDVHKESSSIRTYPATQQGILRIKRSELPYPITDHSQ